jgi:hypothetical protein
LLWICNIISNDLLKIYDNDCHIIRTCWTFPIVWSICNITWGVASVPTFRWLSLYWHSLYNFFMLRLVAWVGSNLHIPCHNWRPRQSLVEGRDYLLSFHSNNRLHLNTSDTERSNTNRNQNIYKLCSLSAMIHMQRIWYIFKLCKYYC